ncbi:MAG: type II toxin-antitoxin system HicA family toxin [Nitrospirae bacterium]|nr:type II toxin-antitoxin system HicA family toxin [Nitrospirota bacterium]MBF0618105.1 type II toxin-antitoxin system HicA family toxin [Nitrospirota bacterium]
MQRLSPVKWKVLECIFLELGFKLHRQEGSHRAYFKPGVIRPVIIPTYKQIDVDIIKSNMRTACLDRETYFILLEKCKTRG